MRFIRGLMLAWLPASIYGVTPVRVAELAEIIRSSPAEDADRKAASALADIHLVERLTDDTLARMMREAPGPRTQTALQDLAADSAFLDPPIAELPHRERPPIAEQKAMLARTVNYASGFIRALPDFICTIETRLLDDGEFREKGMVVAKSERFRLRNIAVSGLTFESGRESYAIQTINGRRPRGSQPVRGLTTWGEFGPLMASLLLADSDASIFWSHWETFDGKQLAVLGYAVDAAHSRYAVSWCCSSIPGALGRYPPVTANVAYTGQIFIDPDSGTILRLTRQTVDVPIDSHIDLIQTVVDYRSVKIGGALYVCPFRSISVARETRNVSKAHTRTVIETVTNLNEVHFTGYRKFETESKVLSESPPPEVLPGSPSPVAVVDPAEPMLEPAAPASTEDAAPSETKEVPLVKAPMPDTLDLPLPAPLKIQPEPPTTHTRARRPYVRDYSRNFRRTSRRDLLHPTRYAAAP